MIGLIVKIKLVVQHSAVTLGHFLDFFLLLQGVGGLQVALLDVDQLVGEHLGDGLLGSEGVLPDSLGDQVDGLVDPSQRGNVDCLLSHHTTGSDSGRVFPGSSLNHCVDEHFQGVSSGEEVDDLESVAHDADGFHFFTGISAVELQRSDKSLDDGAESLSELFGLVSAGGVGHEDLGLGGCGGDVVDEAGVGDLRENSDTLMSS